MRAFLLRSCGVLLSCFLWPLSPVQALTYMSGSDLRLQLEMLEDKSGQMSIDQVVQDSPENSFQALGKSANFGYSKSAFWFRFQLDPDELLDEDVVLLFGYSQIDEIAFYIPDGKGQFLVKKTGRALPFEQRDINTNDLHFTIPKDSLRTGAYYYLRAFTSSSNQYPVRMMGLKEYLLEHSKTSFAPRLYLGAIAIMFTYNAVFSLMTLDLIYFLYVVFIGCSATLVLSLQGFSYQYFWPEASTFNRVSIPFLIAGWTGSLCIFSLKSLDMLQKHRKTHTALKAITIFALIVCASAFVLKYSITIKLALLSALPGALLLFGSYIALAMANYRPAYFFLLSFSALLVSIVLYILKTVGILPANALIENSLLIGSSIQVTLQTFGLADRFRELKAQHAKMQAEMIQIQEDNIRQLDAKVAEKTADIRSILETINMGIFTLSGNPARIDAEKSKALEQIFPETSRESADPIETIWAQASLSKDKLQQIEAFLTSAIDSDVLNYEINLGAMPRSFSVPTTASEERYFETDCNPILDSEGVVKKLLVAIRDVTEIKRLEAINRKNTQEHGRLLQIIEIPELKFRRFKKGVDELMQEGQTILASSERYNAEQLRHFYVAMHTMKGTFRTFGLLDMAEQVHHIEDSIQLNRKESTAELGEEMRGKFASLRETWDSLCALAREKLGRSESASDFLLNQAAILRLQGILDACLKIAREPKLIREIDELRIQLLATQFESFDEVLDDVVRSTVSTAKALGKREPRIDIKTDAKIFVPDALLQTLNGIFIHMFTNAVDHGIETPEDRRAAGKSEQGCIQIEFSCRDPRRVSIKVHDDGRGLDLLALRAKSSERGMVAADCNDPVQIAATVFAPGVSTARAVTDISGRGVGMDAVRTHLRAHGGEIEIVLEDAQPKLSSGVAVSFLMHLPSSEFIIFHSADEVSQDAA